EDLGAGGKLAGELGRPGLHQLFRALERFLHPGSLCSVRLATRRAPCAGYHRAVPNLIIAGDSIRNPEIRHEVPLAVPDLFLYLERDGTRVAILNALEVARARDLGIPGLEVRALEEFGSDEMALRGLILEEINREVALLACQELGIATAVAPPTFPLEIADRLREGGIEVRADRADRARPVPARPRERVPRRHDAHVRRRRAARGARPVPGAREGGARSLADGGPPRRERHRDLPPRLRLLPGARLPDPALEGAGPRARGRVLPRSRAR